jgi:zinc transport system permease protein
VIAIFIFIVIFTSYKKIVTLCFDETYAAVSGINIKSLQLLLTIIIALVISLFIDIIGVLLIASLMILPVAAAILVGDSFLNTIITAIIFSEFSLLTGFVISYRANLTTGPIIILINILILAIVMSISKVKSKSHKTKDT